ncbi:bcl-2-like protein [Pimephales promelas]|nr:bcl-2-like protein [Pimephales promelas]
MESEQQNSYKLVKRVINGQARKAGTSTVSLNELDELKIDEEDPFLDDVSEVIKEVGNTIDKNPRFKRLTDEFACVANEKNLWKLAYKVIADGITWGKIVTLIWIVGKAVVKMERHSLQRAVDH